MDADKPSGQEPTELASAASKPAATLETGHAIGGRYEVEDVLGSGGMGVVYRARDRQLDRLVAVKVLRTAAAVGSEACQQLCARLTREARAMAKLSHPNLVPVFDVGTLEGRVFIVMEHISGGTLRSQAIDERPWNERLDLLLQAGRGLAEAHAGDVFRAFVSAVVGRSCDAKIGDLRRSALIDENVLRFEVAMEHVRPSPIARCRSRRPPRVHDRRHRRTRGRRAARAWRLEANSPFSRMARFALRPEANHARTPVK